MTHYLNFTDLIRNEANICIHVNDDIDTYVAIN